MTTMCGWCLPGDHRSPGDPRGESLAPYCPCTKPGCCCAPKADWPPVTKVKVAA